MSVLKMSVLKIFQSVILALAAYTLSASPPAAQPQSTGPVQSVPLLKLGQGLFLHLSDIHFDPFDAQGQDTQNLVDSLMKAKDVSEWVALFSALPRQQFPSSGADTNYPLLISALKAAGQHGTIDYVVFTGDYLRHNFVSTANMYRLNDDKTRSEFAARSVEFVNLMIRKYVGGAGKEVPLVAAIGNNDSACNDYQLSPPNGTGSHATDEPFLDGVGAALLANNPTSRGDFEKGGYYLIRHPNPNVRNHDFVVLSVFWARNYEIKCGPTSFPNACDSFNGIPDDTPGGAALCWLSDTLKVERQAGRKVTLVMHIPPGVDGFAHSQFWKSQHATGFGNIANAYRDILNYGYAGHTHEDEFRVLADQQGAAHLAVHMAPSVTAWRGNWPAFTVFTYDTTSGDAVDYVTYRLQGGSQRGDGTAAKWNQIYAFSQTYGQYGIDKYDLVSLKKLADVIDPFPFQQQNSVCSDFMTYYNYNGTTAATCTRNIACALNNPAQTAYDACNSPGGNSPPRP